MNKYAVIGNPIHHSLSPTIHAQFAKQIGLSMSYEKILAPLDGFTVTAKNFISSGKGFVCIHISGCVPDTWNGYGDITGGGWVMGQSFHPPYSQFTVNVKNDAHPGAAGLSDFETDDELYMNIDYRDGNDVFLSAEFDGGSYSRNRAGAEEIEMAGGTFPLAWTRSYGSGKVFVTLLGHDGKSHQNAGFQKLVLNGVDWATS